MGTASQDRRPTLEIAQDRDGHDQRLPSAEVAADDAGPANADDADDTANAVAGPPAAGAQYSACRRMKEIERENLDYTDIFPVPTLKTPDSLTLPHSERTEVVRATDLVKEFPLMKGAVFRRRVGTVHAVDGISFDIREGETLALVGESGSGKSTVANIVLNLIDPTSGKVYHHGTDLSTLGKADLFALRRRLQPVFQNPYGSLDPMRSVFSSVEEPLRVHQVGSRKEREARVAELLDMVALPRSAMRRYPGELSGGQRQRVAVARALALRPEVVVLDEAVSALDVLVQSQILTLLSNLQSELGLSYLFITHDLAVVRLLADDVVVMEKGKVVESGPSDELFANPRQEYTQRLIAAVPGAGIDLYRDAA